MAVNAASQEDDKQEYTSFWDRLTAGNIDDVSDDKDSAYQRFNPKAKAAREADEAMKAGASAAAEAGIAAGKEADAESVAPAANDVKSAHEAFRAEERKQFSDSFNMSDAERAAASEKEPGWDTKPDAAAAPAAKPVARKPVAKPAAQAPAVDPAASTLKAAPVAKPTLSEELKTKAQADIASNDASKIKLPAAQPATLKQKFASDNANIKGVMVDGQPAMRPDATPAPRAKFYGSEFK